jgi:prohibitin 2
MIDYVENTTYDEHQSDIIMTRIALGLIALIFILSFLILDVVKVNTREIAIITEFGKVKNVINGGWGVKIPVIQAHDATYDTSVQSLSVVASTATSDQQTLQMKINVQYRIDPTKVVEIYKLVKDQKYLNEFIIPPFVQEATKASTVKFNAEQLLINRDKVKQEVEKALGDRLKEYYSTVVAVNIENIDWSDAYDKAIENKVVLQQETYQAQQGLEKAKAEAETTRIKGESLRLNPEVLEKLKLDKWDGKLPQAVGTGTIIQLK